MPSPLSKDDLAVLRTIARGQPSDYPPDEAIMERLAKAKLITQRRGRWTATELGQGELDKRKAPTGEPGPAG